MWKTRLGILALIVAIIFGCGLLVGVLMPRLGSPSVPVALNTATLLLRVQSLHELVTVKYVFEKAVVLESPAESPLGKLFSGQDRVVLIAHGIVKGGVDLQKLSSDDITLQGTNLTLRLPAAIVTDAYLDEARTQIVEHKTGLFRTADKNLQQIARVQALGDIRRAALYTGILRDADTRAREELQRVFGLAGVNVQFADTK
jgi:hypothetical protein